MDEHQKSYAKRKKPDSFKNHILYDSIYKKFLDKANLQRRKAEQWLPGLRVRAETDCSVKGTLRNGRNTLKLSYGDGIL